MATVLSSVPAVMVPGAFEPGYPGPSPVVRGGAVSTVIQGRTSVPAALQLRTSAATVTRQRISTPSAGSAPPPSLPYVLPGTVGYIDLIGSLTSFSPPGSGYPGAGNVPGGSWVWEPYGMRYTGTSPLTLDGIHVYGCVYTASAPSVTITESIIESGTGSEFSAIYAPTAPVTVSDSTLGWLPGMMPAAGLDVSPVYTQAAMTISRCDLSGAPQGLDPSAAGFVISDTWIHDLVQNGGSGPQSHMDGIFVSAGNGLISGCYIDAPLTGTVTAAIFFQDSGDTGNTVTGCYLTGGAYSLYNETSAGLVVTNCTFGGGIFGDALVTPGSGASIGAWTGNIHPDGSNVPSP